MSRLSCTIVTANVDANRSLDDCWNSMEPLLAVDCCMVVFATEPLAARVATHRTELGFGSITHVIVVDLNDIGVHLPQVLANRATFQPRQDPSSTPCWHKVKFIQQVINENPFGSRKIAWVDADCSVQFTDFHPSTLLLQLEACLPEPDDEPDDCVHLQLGGVYDPRFVKPEHWREWYADVRRPVSSCLMVFGAHTLDILQAVWDMFLAHLDAGFGWNDEMLWLGILDRFYSRIVKSYGCQQLVNFHHCTTSTKSVFATFVCGYRDLNQHRECYDCCRWLLKNNAADSVTHFKTLFQIYVSSFSHRRSEAAEWAAKIAQLVADDAAARAAFLLQKDFYNQQLQFANATISDQTPVTFVTACESGATWKLLQAAQLPTVVFSRSNSSVEPDCWTHVVSSLEDQPTQLLSCAATLNVFRSTRFIWLDPDFSVLFPDATSLEAALRDVIQREMSLPPGTVQIAQLPGAEPLGPAFVFGGAKDALCQFAKLDALHSQAPPSAQSWSRCWHDAKGLFAPFAAQTNPQVLTNYGIRPLHCVPSDQFRFDERNCFCISAPNQPQRWQRMQARFQRFQLPCSRWVATEPREVTQAFHSWVATRVYGCSESHMRLWRHMLAQKLDYALILEDDAQFDLDWQRKLPPRPVVDWDLFLLNSSAPVEPVDYWVPCQRQHLTGAYILSRCGAEWLVAEFGSRLAESDHMTWMLQNRKRSFGRFPWLVIQEDGESTHGGDAHKMYCETTAALQKVGVSASDYF